MNSGYVSRRLERLRITDLLPRNWPAVKFTTLS